MKNAISNRPFLVLLILILTPLVGNAQSHNKRKSYYEHLTEINEQWKFHPESCPNGETSFTTDEDRIQMHLKLVLNHLKLNPPKNLDVSQVERRKVLLNTLEDYADNKVFPTNHFHPQRQPYFVDNYGVHCAVGQLMAVSGKDELVAEIRKKYNYSYLEEMPTPPLQTWAKENGFTLEELKWIQPNYPPNTNIQAVLNGANNTVNSLSFDPYDGRILIAGEFSELNQLPCLNVGYYKQEQLNCFGNGLSGTINDVFSLSGIIYAFGEIEHNGQVYPMAEWDGVNWNFLEIPSRSGASCTAAKPYGNSTKFQVSISHPAIPGKQEIWYYLYNNSWEKKAGVNGIIYDIEASSYGSVFAGHFDTLWTFDGGLPLDTLAVHNVAIKSTYNTNWYGLGQEISDTVKVVKSVYGTIIFGGTCSNQNGASNVCLTRYYNGTLQPLYLNPSMTEAFVVNDIALNNGAGEIIIGGKFYISAMIGTYGSNLASYSLTYNHLEALADFDAPVKALSYFGQDLYIGGEFTSNLNTNYLNHLARLYSVSGLNESEIHTDVTVYPNPFQDMINVNDIPDGTTYTFFNTNGQVVLKGKVTNQEITGLGILSKGIYHLKLEHNQNLSVLRLVK